MTTLPTPNSLHPWCLVQTLLERYEAVLQHISGINVARKACRYDIYYLLEPVKGVLSVLKSGLPTHTAGLRTIWVPTVST